MHTIHLLREREAQASLLASSIEGNAASKAQAELENASDEEEKFSAVVRPSHENRERREPRDFRDFSNRSSDRGGGQMGAGGGGPSSANTGGGSVHSCTQAKQFFKILSAVYNQLFQFL